MLKSVRNWAKLTWMPCPKIETEYPGLAYLYSLDQLFVVKKADAYHDVIGKTDRIPFIIYNKNGDKVLLGTKNMGDCECDTILIKVFNIYGNEVIKVIGPKDKALIFAPPGHYRGTIEKPDACDCNECIFYGEGIEMKLKEVIKRAQNPSLYDEEVLKSSKVEIKPTFGGITTHEVILEGAAAIGTLMEKCVVKNVPGDNFSVSFPSDMSIEDKAALLGACLVIWIQ